MKIDLVLIHPLYNVCRELRRKASNYEVFGKDDIADMLDMCGDFLKLGGHAHMFCSSTQLLSWVKAVSAAIESAKFQNSEGHKQIRDKALFDHKKRGLVYLMDWRIFNRNSSQITLYDINMLEQALHFGGDAWIWIICFQM